MNSRIDMSRYGGAVQYKDIGTIMLENRIINLVGEVNQAMAYEVTSALHVLNNESKTKEITILIDSQGGSCIDGLAIIDTMNFIDAPVTTICTGMAASMGAAILCSGDKRMALPNSRILFHQASGGMQGQILDVRTQFKDFEEINERLAKMISENCGLDIDEYKKLVDRDLWMWPEDALPGKFGKLGAIDEVIPPKKKKTV